MRILIRYVLLQVPGWILLGGLLWWFHANGWVGTTAALGVMAAFILKDALLYPVTKRAYEDGPATGAETLIGRETDTIMPLDPAGMIKLDGENWRARARGGDIDAGRRIRVTGNEGLTLLVEPVEPRGDRWPPAQA